MHALHHEILPPSGVEFVTSLKLTPSTLPAPPYGRGSTTNTLCNLVLARSNLLRIFEVREEQAPFPSPSEEGRDERVRKGTEAVEGEAEMDTGGDGFVNISKVIRVLANWIVVLCVRTSNLIMLSLSLRAIKAPFLLSPEFILCESIRSMESLLGSREYRSWHP